MSATSSPRRRGRSTSTKSDPRGIYGEASREEVAGLIEDGVDFLPLPRLPDEAN